MPVTNLAGTHAGPIFWNNGSTPARRSPGIGIWNIDGKTEEERGVMFDWSFVQRYAPFFVKGMEMTLFISVIGIVLALVVGLVCAGIELARVPVARQIVRV